MPYAPRLIAITDLTSCGQADLLRRAEQLCRSSRPGSIMIQLRDRELGVLARLRLGRELARITGEHSQALSVNDRLDLALAIGTRGLHLGESSVPAERVRERFGARFWLTRAAHRPEACEPLGADAVLLSPVCSPRKGATSHGIDALARACELAGTPVYALGGVSAENAKACIDAGAAGVAVIGAWLACDSPGPLVAALGIAL